MKQNLLSITGALVLAGMAASACYAEDIQALAGKWIADKPDADGRPTRRTLEVTKNKFKFTVAREGQVVLHAEGDVKTEDLGPFKSAKFYNIQGGYSTSDLQPVDDDRTVIYLPGYNEITVASDFDKQRDEPPAVTRYTKAPPSAEGQTLVIDKIVLHHTPQSADFYFCLDVVVGEATKRFNIPDKTYQGSEITLQTDLSIPNARKDQSCKFVMKLDDVAGDECTDEMDNRSAGAFTITEGGSQSFKPENDWSYTIHWHLK